MLRFEVVGFEFLDLDVVTQSVSAPAEGSSNTAQAPTRAQKDILSRRFVCLADGGAPKGHFSFVALGLGCFGPSGT